MYIIVNLYLVTEIKFNEVFVRKSRFDVGEYRVQLLQL